MRKKEERGHLAVTLLPKRIVRKQKVSPQTPFIRCFKIKWSPQTYTIKHKLLLAPSTNNYVGDSGDIYPTLAE